MSSFTTKLTAERVEEIVTFTLDASNGISVTVTQNELDGCYGTLLNLFSDLIDAAQEVSRNTEVSA